MALTNNAEINRKLKLFRSHGITSDKSYMSSRDEDELWNYQQLELGYNYRMTDIQAALGVSQLNRIDEFVEKRRSIAARYDELLFDLPLKIPYQDPSSYSSYHLYLIKLNLNELEKSQIEIYSELREEGILVNLHYIPVYLQPYYSKLGFKKGYCPESENYFKSILSIPIYTSLSKDLQNIVHQSFKKIIF